jgi:plastocyanin domain-containing protein
MRVLFSAMALLLVTAAGLSDRAAAQEPAITIVIRNHMFEPAEVRVPANKRVTITVLNDDPTPEEFESPQLKVEKVIPGKSKATIRIGPLAPGRYPFIGEFNEATAKGVVIAE